MPRPYLGPGNGGLLSGPLSLRLPIAANSVSVWQQFASSPLRRVRMSLAFDAKRALPALPGWARFRFRIFGAILLMPWHNRQHGSESPNRSHAVVTEPLQIIPNE